MNAKYEKVETNTVKLEITVEAEKFNEAIKKAYVKTAKKFNIPGFRKGKAPMAIIKKMYGEGVFYEEAINICCDETYPEALKEHDVHPVDYPSIDIVEIGEGKDLVYTAAVTVMPTVELGKYKGVEVKKVEYAVTDEEIEVQIKGMQEKNARIETKAEGTIEKGNIAVIDFHGFVDGVAFEGGEGHDYSLEVGSGTFIGDFEDQLVGAAKDEKKDVKVTFPENYGRDDLNGKPALFEVVVKEIKVKELPALDDEFAKEVSEFDTLDELKADLKKKAEEANNEKAKREFEENVLQAVCDEVKVEIPQVMIDKEIDSMLKDMEMRLRYQGLDLKTYYEYTGTTEDKMKDLMKDNAEKRIKTDLVIDEIAKAENVTAEEDEIKKKAEEVAKQYGDKDIEKTVDLLVKSQGEYIKKDVVNEKVVRMLVDNTVVVA
ncbi:trigger factor [Clostridium sp. 19966]|uniref:trigger factor n=1 Tax=Clostridium sp. 19966 TaxID=2768166 RepID=UPI0028DE7312|nr:trigger factor [Clostridium sp. 19966]MDT8719375.1 trigger factor [Clostridium sp. 19966]